MVFEVAWRETNMSAQAAGIPRKYAPTIGISVDPRRQNLSEESLKINVERLKDYTKRLIVFPRKSGKTKTGDATKEDVKKAKSGKDVISRNSEGLPIKNVVKVPEVQLKNEKSTEDVYKKLRAARSEARFVGVREKRAKAKADEKESAKK
jgi:large subunit ribosomal protein L13e